jgi:hypothetical protein
MFSLYTLSHRRPRFRFAFDFPYVATNDLVHEEFSPFPSHRYQQSRPHPLSPTNISKAQPNT